MMHVVMMHEMVRIAMVQVAVHVAEQGEQKCEAVSQPMLPDPETGCPKRHCDTQTLGAWQRMGACEDTQILGDRQLSSLSRLAERGKEE